MNKEIDGFESRLIEGLISNKPFLKHFFHQYYQKDSPDLVRNVLFDIRSIYLLAFFKGISLSLVRLINSFGL